MFISTSLHGKAKELEQLKQFLKKKNKMEGISLPNSKTYYVVTALTIGVGSRIGI